MTASKARGRPKLKTFHATVLVTRAEQWWVEAETASVSVSSWKACSTMLLSPRAGRGLHQAVFCSLKPNSLTIASRMMNFCTLPVTVIGKASTNLM
jgi:hypothetical protein